MCGMLRKVKKSFPKQSDTMKEITSLNNSLNNIHLYTILQDKDMTKDKSNRMDKNKSNRYNNYKTTYKPTLYNNYIKSEYIIIYSNRNICCPIFVELF